MSTSTYVNKYLSPLFASIKFQQLKTNPKCVQNNQHTVVDGLAIFDDGRLENTLAIAQHHLEVGVGEGGDREARNEDESCNERFCSRWLVNNDCRQ
jgi:hypothetical protein